MDEIKAVLAVLLTIEQWKVLVFILVITSAITETAKRVFFIRMPKVRKKRWVYATAFITGALAAGGGVLLIGVNGTPAHLWAVFGATAGPLANFLHWATLGLVAWKAPALADALKGKPND